MNDNFWSRVVEILEQKDISRKEFAAQVGISYSSIHNGVSLGSIPSADIALKIADKLDTSIEYLVYGNNPKTEASPDSKNTSKNQEQFLYRKNKDIISAIERLSPDVRSSLKDLIAKIGKN